MSVSGIGGGISVDRVLALRQQILEQNSALQRASQTASATNTAPIASASHAPAAQPGSFSSAFEQALGGVNDQQNAAGQLTDAYQRGETVDIAKVMLARQKASVSFEATLQVRNKILSAYKDIMSMPV